MPCVELGWGQCSGLVERWGAWSGVVRGWFGAGVCVGARLGVDERWSRCVGRGAREWLRRCGHENGTRGAERGTRGAAGRTRGGLSVALAEVWVFLKPRLAGAERKTCGGRCESGGELGARLTRLCVLESGTRGG